MLTLLYYELKNWFSGIRNSSDDEKFRGLLFILLVAAFIVSAEYLSFRVFRAFTLVGGIEFEFIAMVLTLRTLALFFLIIFALLFFGTLIASIDALYFDEDIDFLASLPISKGAILAKKFVQIYLTGSWIVFLVVPPVMLGYSRALGKGFIHLPLSVIALFFFSLIASSLASAVVIFLVRFIPIDRAKESVLAISVLLSFAVIYLYRLLSPSKLFTPGRLLTDASNYIKELTLPLSDILPSSMMTQAFVSAVPLHLSKYFIYMLQLAVLSGAAILVYFVIGYFMFQTDRPVSGNAASPGPIEKYLRIDKAARFFAKNASPTKRMLVYKEIMENLRDPMQISHIFLMFGIVFLHIANLSEIPYKIHSSARTLIAFLNLGLVGFLISAVAVRFVYPGPSLEGKRFWFIESAPVSSKDYVKLKYLVAFIPLSAVSAVIIVFSNYFIGVGLDLSAAWVISVIGIASAITSLGVAAGFSMPSFSSSNVFEISSSQGGIIYLVISLLFVGGSVVILVPPTFDAGVSKLPFFGLKGIISLLIVVISSYVITRISLKSAVMDFEKFINKRYSGYSS